jgi:hypothetical protein
MRPVVEPADADEGEDEMALRPLEAAHMYLSARSL